MFLATIVASGLFAGYYIMPGVLDEKADAPPSGDPPPVVRVQDSPTMPTPSISPEKSQQGLEFTPFPKQAQFETGDTWISNGHRYRLYGLQTCLRGTKLALSQDVVRDCGELNLIMAQALIRDTKPVCTTIKELDANNSVVACQTTAGERSYDLATYMIAQGWGFAAVDGAGQLVVPGYRVAEESAREARVGLWAYSDLPHPVAALLSQQHNADH